MASLAKLFVHVWIHSQKAPNIASNDNETLQKFADETQVMFDTLKSLDCLAEMNVDNLEKMISRLPKWMQSKFAEHLRKNEQGGRVMPHLRMLSIS